MFACKSIANRAKARAKAAGFFQFEKSGMRVCADFFHQIFAGIEIQKFVRTRFYARDVRMPRTRETMPAPQKIAAIMLPSSSNSNSHCSVV